MEWSVEQQKVIDYRNRNILVSAAAGSGKTAVLVERIIRMITDENNPVDIDSLLVVTFTKAAASEMRERIGEALEEAMAKYDKEEVLSEAEERQFQNLQKQLTLIHHAQITTIDSFCLNVVRNHFQEIELDPSFRIADQGEIKLLEMDVRDAVFEGNYSREDNQAFLHLIDSYGNKRGDATVREMVTKIYASSASAAWPKEWVQDLLRPYQVNTVEELMQSPVIVESVAYVRNMLREDRLNIETGLHLSNHTEGLQNYAETYTRDLEILDGLLEIEDNSAFIEAIKGVDIGNLKKIMKYEGPEGAKELAAKYHKAVKENLKAYATKNLPSNPEELLEQFKRMEADVTELVRLTIEYMDAVMAEKLRKHIVDFSDVEHFALQILVDEKTKELTETAREFQETFHEIMIDEYQDSNQVQEDILCAISRMAKDEYNMFMVGDVKQSIYRFRLARPELFMEKYNRYSLEDGKEQRIDLSMNFRSRKEVLDITNDIFEKIMSEDMGKVAYDEPARLNLGATYYADLPGFEPELLIVDQKDELLEDQEDMNKIQSEAVVVANRIRKLMDEGLQVYDKKIKGTRPVRYSDIVILLRSLNNFGQEFATTLEDFGIPVHVSTSTGYFSTMEVQTVLSMLKILDNPYQDIPMAAVLKSPMAGLDNEELAEIRKLDEKKSFAECAMEYCKAKEGPAGEFWKLYEKLRAEVPDTPIHTLIEHILAETGYGNYAAALPAGERRFANLTMLVEKAIAYEKTSYKGLFHFVRYIESIRKYNVDFGEADVTGESADVVHIMTIHKSKGLEFPVVFVSGMGKQFNKKDERSSFVVHADLGIGMEEKTNEPRTKRSSVLKNQIANRIKQENLGEELRVLYVALTRAREKLIMTGSINNYAKSMEKYVGENRPGIPLSFASRMSAMCYLDWVIPAMMSYEHRNNLEAVDMSQLVLDQIEAEQKRLDDREEVEKALANVSESLLSDMEKQLTYTYPYERNEQTKIKYSVSELKHASMEQKYAASEDNVERPDFAKNEKEQTIPRFLQGEAADKNLGGDVVVNRGALRGTAIHRAMECLDFAAILSLKGEDEIRAFVHNSLDEMLEKALITDEMRELIYPEGIIKFLETDTALRMARAQSEGNLFKEKPFIMSYEDKLVQGIIDVFWIETDDTGNKRIVVLDYKTDRVEEGAELVLRYKTQLDLYGNALGRAYADADHQPMATESIIYAFHLQEVIKL